MIAETWNDIPNHALVQTTVKTNHGLYVAYKGAKDTGKWLYTPSRGWDIERQNGRIYTWWPWRDATAALDYVVIGHVAPTASDEEIKAACQAEPPIAEPAVVGVRIGDTVAWDAVQDGTLVADSDGYLAIRRGNDGQWVFNPYQKLWRDGRHFVWGDKAGAMRKSDTGRVLAVGLPIKDVTHTELVKLAIKQNPGLPPLA